MSEEKKEFEPMKELTEDVLERINGGNGQCPHYVTKVIQGKRICLACNVEVLD